MRLQETNHSYYCEAYSEKCNTSKYDSWEDFKNYEGLEYDFDYNLPFRFDLDKSDNGYTLELHHVLQRKGTTQWHVVIQNIKERDLPEIESFLKKAKKHLLSMWEEIKI